MYNNIDICYLNNCIFTIHLNDNIKQYLLFKKKKNKSKIKSMFLKLENRYLSF